ncbi:hypothetical protein RQP46_004135 [Phenoliferia psychrophenolica]
MSNFLDLIRLRRLSADTFVSLAFPEPMGPRAPGKIAFGGCVIAMSVQAAYHSLSTSSASSMALYSSLGHFLGPTLVDRPVNFLVQDVRTTRTFATRRVVASQVQDDGSTRSVMATTFDFMTSSPTSFLTFGVPMPSTTHHSELPLFVDAIEKRVEAKTADREVANKFNSIFQLVLGMLDIKHPVETPFARTLWGLDAKAGTGQDHLSLTEKTSLQWIRSTVDLSSPSSLSSSFALPISPESASASFLAFVMARNLVLAPLVMTGHFLSDVAAASALDFAFRIYTDKLDLSKWHLEEISPRTGIMSTTISIQGSTALSSSNLRASILVDGKKVPIYQIQKKGNCMTGFIEAKTGAEFAVKVRNSGNKMAGQLDIYADGEWVNGMYIAGDSAGGHWTETISDRLTGKSGSQSLKMDLLQITAGGQESPDELGTVRVRIASCTTAKKVANNGFGAPKIVGSHRKFVKSVADSFSHETVFGEIEESPVRTVYDCKGDTLQTFYFIYISKELQKLRQNILVLEIEQERLRAKVLKKQNKRLDDELKDLDAMVSSSSSDNDDGDAEMST